MAKRDKGQPSGTNKKEGLGVPNKIPADQKELNEDTEKYTDDADDLNDNIRVLHPNRNVDKDFDTGPPYS
jgi:cytochrome c556